MNDISFFLDSGAFSAYTKDIKIDIQNYITFIKQHQDNITHYAVLDAIGDPEQTLKNQKIMENTGLKPIPCFHYGEDIKYLEYYIDNYDYIALGGMVPISNKNLMVWLDELFSRYICNADGFSKIKIHAFGLTAYELLLRYPWYSVDSTSWLMIGRFGGFYMPVYKDQKFDYLTGQIKITISIYNSSSQKFDQHYFTMSQEKRKIVDLYIEKMRRRIGKSEFVNGKEIIIENGLCNDYKERDKINILYFNELEKQLSKTIRKFDFMENKNRSFF